MRHMTTRQLIWMTLAYLVVLVAVVYFTRATVRRVLGALLGGAVVGVMLLGEIALGESVGWWRAPMASTPSFLTLFCVGAATSCSPIYLVTWRVVRRYGWRGLALCLLVAAAIGPPRDYLIATIYPEWIVFAPGIAPVLAVSAAYVSIVAVGHGIMRLIAGLAQQDRLAQRPWGAA
jgi:hypothetical protein